MCVSIDMPKILGSVGRKNLFFKFFFKVIVKLFFQQIFASFTSK